MSDLVKKNNGDLMVSSREIAKNFDKRHDNVTRDIDRMLERGILSNSDLISSEYKNKRGKFYRMYKLNEKAKQVVLAKYEIGASNYLAIESEYIQTIIKMFPNTRTSEQHSFCDGKYKVDLYLVDLGIVIEIDEKEHEYTKSFDKKREKEIIKSLCEQSKKNDITLGIKRKKKFDYSQWFKIIRIKEGELGEGLRRLMIAIEEITWCSPVRYMHE